VPLSASDACIITGDADSNTTDFLIEQGSKLTLRTTNGFTIKGNLNVQQMPKVNIAGDLAVFYLSLKNNKVDFSDFIGEITATAALSISDIFNQNLQTVLLNSTTDNVLMKGKCTVSQKAWSATLGWPTFNWQPGSELVITGPAISSASVGPTYNKTLYNLTFNYPLMTNTFSVTKLPKVIDTFKLLSTGTSSLLVTTNAISELGVFKHSAGTLNTPNGSTFNINKHYLQSGGVLKNTTSQRTVLNFNGTGNQIVNFHNAEPTGQFTYLISNPTGITLTSSGTLIDTFKINANCMLHINTKTATPITTSLVLKYSTTSSILYYELDSSAVVPALVFPAKFSPRHLWVRVGYHNQLYIPFSRTIADTLALMSGFINTMDSNFTIGSSSTNPGNIYYSNVNQDGIIIGRGTLSRWFNNTSASSSISNGMTFPIFTKHYFNRSLNFEASGSTSFFAAPGLVKVKHYDTIGIEYGLNYSASWYNIINRTYSYWQVDTAAGISLAASSSLKLNLCANGLFNQVNSNFMAVTASNGVGNINAPIGTIPVKFSTSSNVALANISGLNIYLGSDLPLADNRVFTIASGNWNNPAIWHNNLVPDISKVAIISEGTHVISNTKNLAYELIISNLASLTITSDTIQIDNAVENNGAVVVNNGCLRLHNSGGGNKQFVNKGSFTIDSGYCELNGFMNNLLGSTFNQFGGLLFINPYTGNTNHALGHALSFYSNKLQLQAGTIQIFNPSAVNYSSVNSYFYGKVICGANHKLILGGNPNLIPFNTVGNYHFRLSCGFNTFGQLIFNDVDFIANYYVVPPLYITGDTVNIKGNLSLINSARCFAVPDRLMLGGNLFIDTNSMLSTQTAFGFGTVDANGVEIPVAQTQTIKGNGLIVNSPSNPSVSFDSLIINNTSFNGVEIYNRNIIINYKIKFINGKLNNLHGYTQIGSFQDAQFPAGQQSGWLVGKVRYASQYTIGYTNLGIPIGNLYTYLPLHLYSLSNGLNLGGVLSIELQTNDHIAIGQSNILPNKSLNLNYKLKPIGKFTNGSANVGLAFCWNTIYEDLGVNYNNFKLDRYKNNAWQGFLNSGATFQGLTTVVGTSDIEGDYQIGEAGNSSNITLQPTALNICENTGIASFSTAAVSGSTFQWEVNSGTGWANIANSASYGGATASILNIYNVPLSYNGNFYRCQITSGSNTEFTLPVLLQVNPTITPSVSVVSISQNPLCTGDTALVQAVITNGGTSPTINWTFNGVAQTVHGASIKITSASSVYSISCSITSNAACLSTPTAVSPQLVITKVSPTAASVTTYLNSSSTICYNQLVQAKAVAVNGGAIPAFSWSVNGTPVGNISDALNMVAGLSTFTINCTMSPSTDACATTVSANAAPLVVNVISPTVPKVSINYTPYPNVCAGSSVTITPIPINGGASPTYRWFLNGNFVSNANTYISSTLVNTDSIYCVMYPTLQCNGLDSAVSNLLGINFLQPTSYSVTINASPDSIICPGKQVQLTAALNNVTFVSYKWYKNSGIQISTSASPTFTNLVNNDEVYLVITPSGLNCPSTVNDTSNVIRFTVLPVTSPTIYTIPISSFTLCAGDTAKLATITTNTGTSPTYQWYKNGSIFTSTDSILVDGTTANGDNYYCIVYSSNLCASPDSSVSSTTAFTVSSALIPNITIAPQFGSSICAGATLTINSTITNGGSAPTYQWKINNVNVSTAPDYSASNFANGDVVQCFLTSSLSCAVPSLDSSNSITLTVNADVTPTISIAVSPNNIFVFGNTYTFTATATDVGTAPVYKWYKNGILLTGNSASRTFSNLNPTDSVYCILVSNAPCLLANNIKSNSILGVFPDLIDQTSLPSQLEIFPNPSAQYFHLKGQTKEPKVEVKLMTITGTILMEDEIKNQKELDYTLDLKNYASGVYMLQVNEGKRKSIFKLVLEK
jgi:Secretion system C-terminal sorting domain